MITGTMAASLGSLPPVRDAPPDARRQPSTRLGGRRMMRAAVTAAGTTATTPQRRHRSDGTEATAPQRCK
jgi:hypothetical protein